MDTLTAPSDTRFRVDSATIGAPVAGAMGAPLMPLVPQTPLRARDLSRGTR